MSGRLAILASGRGSNLQAILDAIADGSLGAGIVERERERMDPHAGGASYVPDRGRRGVHGFEGIGGERAPPPVPVHAVNARTTPRSLRDYPLDARDAGDVLS